MKNKTFFLNGRYDDLRRLFQKYGKIVDITIPLDYHSRTSRGYAFILYEDARDAEEALYKLDKQPLFGRELEVEFARGDRKSNFCVILKPHNFIFFSLN
jgi:FUS-interacting serine-arginine-rich protein 1